LVTLKSVNPNNIRESEMTAPKTIYDKIWDAHVAHEAEDGTCLLYIDRHLVHEVTSPQAFEGLRLAGRKVRENNRRARSQRPNDIGPREP